jgi:PAS domain S-box-containing protein
MASGKSEEKTKIVNEGMREDRPVKSRIADTKGGNMVTRLSDERYRAFIESINDGVYEVDIHGNFIYFNDALCRVFGYPKEEIQWQNISQFMDKKNARLAYRAFSQVFITHQGFSDIILEVLDKRGETRTIELSASLITNKEGKKIGFRGIARDVTERIRAQEALRKSELRYQQQYEASRDAERRLGKLLDFVPYPMVVFKPDGTVTYLNPAFTEVFGWSFEELKGKPIPYVPPELQDETKETIEKLIKEQTLRRYRTRRLTKDGRIRDVIMKGAVLIDQDDEFAAELIILRDITEESRLSRVNETLLRISQALPEYLDLGDLLDYISGEIKQVLNTEGAIVILLDEVKQELFFMGAAYDDSTTQQKAKKIRYPADQGVSGKVIKTGEPIIVEDTSKDPDYNTLLDQILGYQSHNMLDVPLRSGDRIIGVLCATNKKEGPFDQKDVELLSMIASTVALSIENARYADELKEAYQEVSSLNRAKDKVINHLSHELKTPASVLSASLNILEKKLMDLPEDGWRPTLKRAERNLERILEIQYEVEDIMQDKRYRAYPLLTLLLEQCRDDLESFVAESVGEGPIVERIRKRIEDLYGPKESKVSEIRLDKFVQERIENLKPKFAHRQLNINTELETVPDICIPEDVMQKVIDGLIKNAIENTPDEGRVEIKVQKKGEGTELVIHDYGVGITEEHQRRIFEGFFTTQETMAYSSKRPFDFNAGGKGADLLRMKIFSERYNFKIDLESSRCPGLAKENETCPGKISECQICREGTGCHQMGGTTFSLFFPASPPKGCAVPSTEKIRKQ